MIEIDNGREAGERKEGREERGEKRRGEEKIREDGRMRLGRDAEEAVIAIDPTVG